MGGGLVVLSSGWTMFKPDEVEHEEIRHGVAPQDVGRKAFCPLTLPLTVGPGSGSVAITLGANAPRPGRGHLAMALVAAIIGSLTMSIAMFLSNGFADRIAALLGPAARSVILRLSSFLLACIGLQIRWNGISDLLNTR
jgi:multiple antibiotic resistance protein